MLLPAGTRLGPYEIVSALGVGSMGEVYRATDTKLKRQVAVKILPRSLAADPDRLARFQREAEVLAALNHPHIAAIYGLEDADGVKALVMELVDGDDLSQRLARGPISLDEALPIAQQIAEALEAAHKQGIVHRDLKPANINFISGTTLMVSTVTTHPGLRSDVPHPVVNEPLLAQDGAMRQYDVAPDDRILAIKDDDSVRSDHVVVVENWLSEARAPLVASHK